MNVILSIIIFAASTVLFQDDFNDGNADGWFTKGAFTYQVLDGRYHFSGGESGNNPTSYRGDTGMEMSTPDYSVMMDAEIEVGILIGIMARYREDGLYNIMLVLSIPSQSLNLYRWHWSSIELLDSYPFPVQEGITYRMKMHCSGDTFAGRIWFPEEDEPELWFVTVSDTLFIPGAAALYAARAPNDPTDIYLSCFYDNVAVETPEPWAITQRTWAAIKRLSCL